MPKINRIRITNFSYNNNHRHIIDEIFDFYNGENALLSLANGGGKSVLVQTMLQPIVPKTKLLGRPLSDFFIGKKDPVYIMIEWLLDDEAGFLLTGIGISPSMSYNPNSDEDNLNLRFYTFCHHYEEGNKYDIKNMPITEVKNNGLIVAGYNDIKKLIQSETNKGKFEIEYFNSSKDEQLLYERRLNMYSISRNEWKELMVSINQAEHGVSEVFAKCRSSRQVMEQWIIKYIEKVLDKSTEDKISDHQKLEEMMVQVATAEVENENFIKEYDEIGKFKLDLKRIDEESRKICGLLDNEDKKKRELAGIYHSFSNRLIKMEAEEEQLKAAVELNKNEIEHIDLEEKSYEIYRINSEIDKLIKELQVISEELDTVNELLDKKEYEYKLQQGAREYEVVEEKMQEKAEQQQLLDNATKSQEDLIKEMNRIGYSLKCLYSKRIEAMEIDLDKIEGLINEYGARKTELNGQISQKNKEINLLSSRKGQLEGKTEEFLKYENELFDRLDIIVSRNPLIGELNIEDIDEVMSDYDVKQKALETEYDKLQGSIVKENQQVKIEEKKLSDNIQKITDTLVEQSKNINEITQYEEVKSKIQEIVRKYCNNLFSIFDNDSILTSLRNYHEEWMHKVTSSEMEINEISKMIGGIKEGISYLPITLINELKEHDFDVYTGEQYLRGLSDSDRDKILLNNPILPYGLIVTDKERKIISEIVEDIDLSQLVPLFSHEHKEIMDEGESKIILSNPSLLKYDTDGLEHYIQKLEKQIDILKNEKNDAENSAKEYINAWNVVNDFKWTTENEKELYRRRDEFIDLLEKMISDKTDLEDLIEEISKKISDEEKNCLQLKDVLKTQEENKHLFTSYLERNDEYCQNNSMLQSILSDIEELDKEILKLHSDMDDIDNALGMLKSNKLLKKGELEGVSANYNLFKEADGEEIIDESVSELEGRLNACKKRVSDDVTLIGNRIEGINKDLTRANENIKRLGLTQADVRTVRYSASLEENLHNEIESYNKNKDQHNEKYRELEGKKISLEGERKPKVESLKGNSILDRKDIKGDFVLRRDNITKNIQKLEESIENLSSLKIMVLNLNTRIEAKLEYIDNIDVDEKLDIPIDGKTEEWVRKLLQDFSSSLKDTSESMAGFNKICKEIQSNYVDTISGVVGEAVKGIYSQIEKLTRNYDKYYYLIERISFYEELLISTMKLMQTKIEQLKHSKNDLIEHAYIEAKNVYEEIPKVVDNSSIDFDGVKRKILDIQYDKIQSDEIAKDRIKNHILTCLDSITHEIKSNEDEVKIRKNIIKVLSTKELLNVISNLENFKVKAYKVDINEKNRRMMSWEDLIVKNSGGEKFVAYFSLLVALISYSRKNAQALEMFKKKEESKVLIMDNPFGPITSGHLLKPMFDIAKKYDTQLICLSDIKEGAVINSFNLVYNIKIRQNMMKQEYLDIEENNFADLKVDERLEKAHLYSRVTQMSLLDE